MQINGRFVAFITGAGGGLGSATVRRLHRLGARVAAADVEDKYMEKLMKDIGPSDSLLPIKCNVRNEKEVEAAIQQTLKKFGAVHAAVPCAGIVKATPFTLTGQTTHGTDKPLDMDLFKQIMDVNVMGTVYTSMYAAMAMKDNTPTDRNERGSITLVSSICAYEGEEDLVGYAASKAALQGMMLPMARDMKNFGIRVNCIGAGAFETNIYQDLADELDLSYEEFVQQRASHIFDKIPTGKSDPDDFAHTVQFLIENRYVNAANIRLDGGLRL